MEYDYIDRLEFVEKLLVKSAIAFWFLSIVSVEPGALWVIGILLPVLVIANASCKPAVLCVYAICTIVYVVTAVILTHRFFNYTPHLACCVCVIGGSLMAGTVEDAEGTIRELEKCKFDLEEQRERYKRLKEDIKDWELCRM